MADLPIANPPSHELAREMVGTREKVRVLQVTPLVREALDAAIENGHYDELMSHFQGGAITGSISADGYMLAQKLADWEANDGSTILKDALLSKKIRLVDIVKRIAPLLRKSNFAIERGVCTGTLTQSVPSGS